MNLGERIYELRTEKNMSQGALADALEVSRQSVSKWENNSAVPELEKLVKMADIFGVSLDELVKGQEKEPITAQTAFNPNPESITATLEIPVTNQFVSKNAIAGILVCFAALIIALILGNEDRYNALEIILLIGPILLCGVALIVAKVPSVWCGWIFAIGYWIYFFLLAGHWEKETGLLILGILLMGAALVYTIVLQKKGRIRIPFWGWALIVTVLTAAALLLAVNTIPPAQGFVEPPTPVDSLDASVTPGTTP